ncbi:Probable transcriptional regulatory protein [gamma proteobacterium HdN1]|nr:Probable transcriptional regulatory protein [gamma proteobacterium HdN1]
MRALIVEDEPHLQEQLAVALGRAGYSVDRASDGKEGLYFGTEYNYDIAIVDLGLPQIDGMDVIRRWRESNRIFPVMVLTARSSWQDKVAGLEIGADDYVVKPFQMEEVVARANALVRRAAGITQSSIRLGPIELDTNKKQVRLHEEPLDLTSYEYRVLEYLMMHPEELISKAVLTEHIYAQDFERDSNTIEVFIGRLRKKLDPDNQWKPIETVRGMGYRMNPSL